MWTSCDLHFVFVPFKSFPVARQHMDSEFRTGMGSLNGFNPDSWLMSLAALWDSPGGQDLYLKW